VCPPAVNGEDSPGPSRPLVGSSGRSQLTARTALRGDAAVVTYQRPAPPKADGQTHTTDSAAIGAGARAVPFTRTPPSEQHDGGEREPVDGEEATPRRIEALEADGTPKRPRKKSRYEALPPDAIYLQAMLKDLAAAVTDPHSDETLSEFAALRTALLSEARQSARGGKR